MAKPVSPEERERIIAAFATGSSCYRIAKDFGRSSRTIHNIAKSVGHTFSYLPPKKANDARRTYGRAQRTALLDELLDVAREQFRNIDKPQQIQPVAIGIGVLLDKRRQEDDSDSKRHGTIRQYLELEFNRPGANESQTEDEHPAGG